MTHVLNHVLYLIQWYILYFNIMVLQFRTANVMDNMIAMMEKYSNHLEEIVAERTLQLEEEKKKTETLLYRMLPQ